MTRRLWARIGYRLVFLAVFSCSLAPSDWTDSFPILDTLDDVIIGGDVRELWNHRFNDTSTRLNPERIGYETVTHSYYQWTQYMIYIVPADSFPSSDVLYMYLTISLLIYFIVLHNAISSHEEIMPQT